ncbi:MAG: hypothetical protein GXX79_15940 [Actinomycetales bacterium]|nr:hypothetical protein [Actinomycetales bacterium]
MQVLLQRRRHPLPGFRPIPEPVPDDRPDADPQGGLASPPTPATEVPPAEPASGEPASVPAGRPPLPSRRSLRNARAAEAVGPVPAPAAGPALTQILLAAPAPAPVPAVTDAPAPASQPEHADLVMATLQVGRGRTLSACQLAEELDLLPDTVREALGELTRRNLVRGFSDLFGATRYRAV